jgi:hypothetical protein
VLLLLLPTTNLYAAYEEEEASNALRDGDGGS